MYKTLYHVFTDHRDDFFEDEQEARAAYKALGDVDKRLYIEEYETEAEYEEAAPTNEDCLESNGLYPM